MQKLFCSIKHAAAGIAYCFVTQRNMVIHAAIGLVTLFVAWLMKVTVLEIMLIITAILAVLGAEVFNTALEKTVDLCTRDEHELAQIAKDVSAGAVLLTALFAVMVGLYVFGPRLWSLLFTVKIK